MEQLRICFGCVLRLKVLFLIAIFAVCNEALELDLDLTRKEITTFLGQPANLGCYATKTSSSLTYYWTKDNKTVTQSSNVRGFGDLLVVTPQNDTDFGMYVCNVTDGVSSTLCRIMLFKGLNETENESANPPSKSTTGCVNISVLMPVLAVAIMSLLMFIHLIVRGKRSQDDQMIARMTKKSDEGSSRQSEGSTAVIEESFEMHANGHASGSPGNAHVPRSPAYGHTSRVLEH